jgi:putative endonuclease
MTKDQTNQNWRVYMIRCSDASLYTGITTQMDRRFAQHAQGRGAKYFRGRRPISIAYLEGGHSRSTASKREIELKKLSAAQKRTLVAQDIKTTQKETPDDIVTK